VSERRVEGVEGSSLTDGTTWSLAAIEGGARTGASALDKRLVG